ncbi:hypothetical protein V4Y02_23455, partial [Escherichia coli]
NFKPSGKPIIANFPRFLLPCLLDFPFSPFSFYSLPILLSVTVFPPSLPFTFGLKLRTEEAQ